MVRKWTVKAKYVQHKHAGVHHRLVLISGKITTGGLKVRWYHAQIPGKKCLSALFSVVRVLLWHTFCQ